MEKRLLIKIINGRYILLVQGKKAINAGGLEKYYGEKMGFRFFVDQHKYPLLLAITVILILIILIIYGYIQFENYLIRPEVEGFVKD